MSTASVARAWRLIEALSGHSFEGRQLKAIADTVDQSPSTTLRDLNGLESLGLVERIPGREHCWRLASRLIQIGTHHMNEMARLRQRIDDLDRSCTRTPY